MSIYFYGCITIDGYLADQNHRLDWLYQTGSVEETGYNDFYKEMDITIMGKKTFDEVAKMDNAGLAYPTTENYVFTHAKALPVSGFPPVSADVVAFVKGMEKDKNIWVVGGNQLMAPLLDNDLIDTMIIQIAPVLLGKGIPLFTQNDIPKRFYLEEVNRYGPFAELVYKK
ncbi:dihydrofolate reductase family protein [Christensenellaceae bacterium OttesenSCG-928-L17]|nr:dihydrofolate reductase family protein [Christensenellaceae bacterium OttesenSCG-928-L17]